MLIDYGQRARIEQDSYFIDAAASDNIIDPSTVPLFDTPPYEHGFSKISEYHGRSIIDPNNLVFNEGNATDEFGNTYTAFSIKGSEAGFPRVSYESIQPNKVKINGMLEATTFERCQETSRHLREHGILTEWPFYHGEPVEFPIRLVNTEDRSVSKSILIEPSGFRERLYELYIAEQQLKREHRAKTDALGRVGLVGQVLSEMHFGVMYRATLSNARIPDIGYLTSKNFYGGELSHELRDAITSLQARDISQFKAHEELMRLDPNNESDHERYLETVLPMIIGENLARFQNANCVHSYPHSGNWTLAGELVDLDTVECSELYEEDIPFVDEDSRLHDLAVVLLALDELIGLCDIDQYEVYHRFSETYVTTRFDAENTTENDRILMEAILGPVDYSRYPEIPMAVIITDEEINQAIDEAVTAVDNRLDTKPLDHDESIFELLTTAVLKQLEPEIAVQALSFTEDVLPRTKRKQRDQITKILIARQMIKLLQGRINKTLWASIEEIHSRLGSKIVTQ